jgi:hypothetical protein
MNSDKDLVVLVGAGKTTSKYVFLLACDITVDLKDYPPYLHQPIIRALDANPETLNDYQGLEMLIYECYEEYKNDEGLHYVNEQAIFNRENPTPYRSKMRKILDYWNRTPRKQYRRLQ